MLPKGSRIGGYEIIRCIGQGGVAEVYLAKNKHIPQVEVAIKLIQAETAPYIDKNRLEETVNLFKREAQVTSTLEHPHILRLHHFGEADIDGIKRFYLIDTETDTTLTQGEIGVIAYSSTHPTQVLYLNARVWQL